MVILKMIWSEKQINNSAMNRSLKSHKFGNDLFLISDQYSNLELIGRGAYGSVVSAWDSIRREKVAIKKTNKIFYEGNVINLKRVIREVKLLRHFNSHENVVTIHEIMTMPPDTEDFTDVYIVLNLMESDLDKIIASPQPLSEQHNQYFLYQILRGLKFVHSANVVHRDLKPSNLLINANCDIALCDFGLSRGVSGEVDNFLTEYVVTRWYRAPELLCESRTYGKSVDIWSVGCIFAELLCRKPFFQGTTPLHQLAMIVEVLGCPPASELGFADHSIVRDTIDEARSRKRVGLETQLKNIDKNALDLLQRMLVVKPQDRITAEEALAHPYLHELHVRMEEPNCEKVFDDRSLEKNSVSTARMKDMKKIMYQEMLALRSIREISMDSTEAIDVPSTHITG